MTTFSKMLRPAVILCLLQGILCLTSEQQLSSSNVTTEIVECFTEAVDKPWQYLPDESSRVLYFIHTSNGRCGLQFWRTFECYYSLIENLVKSMHYEAESHEYETSYYEASNLEDYEVAVELQKEAARATEETIFQIQEIKKVAAVRNETRILADNCSTTFLNMDSLMNTSARQTKEYYELSIKLDILRVRHYTLWYYLPPFIIVVFICGMLGNGLLLLIFVLHSETRTGPNAMLVNLAISDTLFLFCNVVLDYCKQLWGFPLGVTACYVYNFLLTVVTGCSVYSMTILSFSRYMAVTARPGDRSHRLLTSMPVMLAAVWVLSLLVAIPDTLSSVEYNEYDRRGCLADNLLQNSIPDFLFISFLPLIAITCFYIAASRRLRESARNIPGEALGQAKVKMARERGSRILPALAIVFAITYLPFYTFWFIKATFNMNDNLNIALHVSYYIVYFLFNLNSTLNPVALYLASSMFRAYFNKYLCLRFLKKQSSQENSSKSNVLSSRV